MRMLCRKRTSRTIDDSNDRTLIGKVADKAFRLQVPQRLAHAGAAYTGQLAEFPLDQPVTRFETEIEDRLADDLENLIAQGWANTLDPE